ncbi:MAG: type VI secretion system tube protein Hcp [Zavarzinella sp.]|nr:type VI secretion system tube protein Hcp [Zavarzinella sp.]
MFDTVRARLRRRPGRPPRARRLGVERLEGRDVPAILNPLALLPGEVTAPHQPDWVQLQVQTSSPRALLTFEADPAAGSDLDPGRVKLFAGAGAHAGSPGMVHGPGYTLRAASSGMFFARVAGAKGSTGAFDLAVGLAGDVNGDQQVDAQDLDAIRALFGTRSGQAGFDPAADVNHNGMIGPGDLALARRNLGVTATVGPLTADQFLFAGSDALGLTRSGQSRIVAATPQIGLSIPGIANGNPMDVETFSWGVFNTAGRPSKSDIVISKKTDAASPSLFLACATGQHFQNATLSVKRAGPASPVILKWELSDVVISSYQTSGGHGGASPSLEESIALNFTKIKITYTPILPTGKPGTPVVAEFDFNIIG